MGVLAVGSFGQGNAGSCPWAAACLVGVESLSLLFVCSLSLVDALIMALIMRGGVDGLRTLCMDEGGSG